MKGDIDYCTWSHPDPDFHQGKSFPDDPFKDKPIYEALSYTWGSGKTTENAYIIEYPVQSQIASAYTTLKLSHNLACALRYLRYADAPRTLWVDALW